MKNLNKVNILMQYKTILEAIHNEVDFAIDYKDDAFQLDTDGLIEMLKGVKEIEVSLKTLTN